MISIHCRNVNDAWPEVCRIFGLFSEDKSSISDPVSLSLSNPRERVLFARKNWNPFSHLMRSLWTLAGRNDLAFIEQFDSSAKAESDNGADIPASIGYRWRSHFAADMLFSALYALQHGNKHAALCSWDPVRDRTNLGRSPRSIAAVFRIVNSTLAMTVFHRQADLMQDVFGANICFSFLQELLANAIGLDVGSEHHVFAEMFLTEANAEECSEAVDLSQSKFESLQANPYRKVAPLEFLSGEETHLSFLRDCQELAGNRTAFSTEFFQSVVKPMFDAWAFYSGGETARAIGHLACLTTRSDWIQKGLDWLTWKQKN